jgi:hypothetical protein
MHIEQVFFNIRSDLGDTWYEFAINRFRDSEEGGHSALSSRL